MKYILIFFMILFANNASANEIVAIIGNNKIVTSDELEQIAKLEILALKRNFDAAFFNSIRHITLEKIVDRKLFAIHGEKSGVKIPDSEITNDILRISLQIGCKVEPKTCFNQNGIRYDYVYDFVKTSIIQSVIIQSFAFNSNPITDAEIEKIIKISNIQNTDDNREKARNLAINQRIRQAEINVKSMLKKMYYIEIR